MNGYLEYINTTPSDSPILGVLCDTYKEYAGEVGKSCNQYQYVSDLITIWKKKDANQHKHKFISQMDSGIKKPNYDVITTYIQKTFATLTFKDRIYIYDKEKGIYRPDEGQISELVINLLKKENYTNIHPIKGILREIQSRIKAMNIILEYPFNRVDILIPCKNGVLDPRTQRLVPHSPAYGFTYTINAEYLPEVDCTFIEKHLPSWVAPKNYEMLLNLGASCLLRQSYKKLYIIYNRKGNNGKTTFLNLLTDMLGKENTSSLSLQDFDKGGFRVSDIDGKSANICGDLPPTKISDTSLLKKLTGADSITVERKYVQSYDIYNRAIMIFGANEPPAFNDKTDAFYSRIVMIEFPNQFTVDLDFNKKLKEPENLSALLKVFVDHIPMLLKSGITTDAEAMRDQHLRGSDSVYRFFEDNLVKDEFGEIEFNLVFDVYREYCTENKLTKVGTKKFIDRISEHFDVQTRSRGSIGEQVKHLEGVQFKAAEQQTNNQTEQIFA